MTPRKRIALAGAGLLLVLAVGAGAWLVQGLAAPAGEFEAPVVLEIPRGASSREMARLLEERGVIRSETHFMLARAWRSQEVLQAGEYEFTQPATVWEAYDKLVAGEVVLYPLTVPEGLTRFEVSDVVALAGFGSKERFLELTADPTAIKDLFPDANSLEGCLYPETYNFPRSTPPDKVLEAMLRAFRSAFETARKDSPSTLNPYEALTLASLVEKETGVDEERPLVSSVFHNRLRLGMLLQCDPTIIYGLLVEGRYRGALYEAELRDPTPYNTYIHPGLPPGPIANPGLDSIEAAHRPADSNYLFFVVEAAGKSTHVFSENLAAHNQAVAQYRETLAR